MSMEFETLTRAQLAKKAGVGLEAIRFYERKGLLLPAYRDGANYRRYHSEAIDQLRFISKTKGLGFALSEIKELQEIRDLATNPCQSMREKARSKISEIDAKIEELRHIRGTLDSLVGECERNEPSGSCAILDNIES